MRTFRTIVLAGVALVSFGSLAIPASAVTMKATYTGNVYSSYDQTGLFGLGANSDFDSLPFVLQFIYDPSLPGIDARTTDAASDLAIGGPDSSGTANPVLSSQITIAGHTEAVSGDYGGRLYAFNDGSFSETNHANYGNSLNDQLWAEAWSNSAYFPPNLETSVPLTLITGFATGLDPYGTGYFQFIGADHNAYGSLNLLTVEISQVSAVPLPAALPLLAGGLAGLAYIARRRQKAAKAA